MVIANKLAFGVDKSVLISRFIIIIIIIIIIGKTGLFKP
jgi:hypothetical protein